MENRYDFMEWLGPDTSSRVLMCLDNPADLVRASAVSHSWRRFVIENGFCKRLCLGICPEVANFIRITEESESVDPLEAGSSNSGEWEILERDHRVYAYLIRPLISPMSKLNCLLESISASSTDNYPEESIENTLEESDRVDDRPSYWSSSGASDPEVPETLTYKLGAKLCVVKEINIQPFQAFFQPGNPIYSAKAVRFRMGHSRSLQQMGNTEYFSVMGQKPDDDAYIWTYVSPIFPMLQDNVLQSFKLPRPVMCIGGIMQIELLGRVQRQEMDNLYYVCVCHAQVVGHPLSPTFDVDILDTGGKAVLKYYPDAANRVSMEGAKSEDEMRQSSGLHAFVGRIRQIRAGRAWNQVLLSTLLGTVVPVENVDDDSDDEPFA